MSKSAILFWWVVAALSISEALNAGDAGAQCIQPPPGLTGWWPGDGNAVDIVNRHDATLHGDATTGPGLVAGAFLFDGDGDFASVPHNSRFDFGTGPFTVDLWVRFSSTAGEQVLIEKFVETSNPTRTGWTLTKLSTNAIQFTVGSDPAESAPLTLSPDTWIHFAARRDGTQLAIFMNGALIATGTSTASADSTSSLKFGHRGNPDDTPGSTDDRNFFLNGAVDEVEVFAGRALGDQEIQSLFAASSDGKCKPSAFAAPILSPLNLGLMALVLAGASMWRLRKRGPGRARSQSGILWVACVLLCGCSPQHEPVTAPGSRLNIDHALRGIDWKSKAELSWVDIKSVAIDHVAKNVKVTVENKSLTQATPEFTILIKAVADGGFKGSFASAPVSLDVSGTKTVVVEGQLEHMLVWKVCTDTTWFSQAKTCTTLFSIAGADIPCIGLTPTGLNCK